MILIAHYLAYEHLLLATSKNPIPKRLKEARLAAKLSQKKLGIAAGIDEFSASARMNQYETGKHIPDYLTLKRIARILNCPTGYFYTEDDMLAKIMILLNDLNKDKRKKLLEMLKSF